VCKFVPNRGVAEILNTDRVGRFQSDVAAAAGIPHDSLSRASEHLKEM
jgi:hypothetical protein